jgi:hypothetical protein
MVLVKNVEKKIWDLEGFAVRIKDGVNNRDKRPDGHLLTMYSYIRATKGDMTIAQWIKTKFLTVYSGVTVDVFLANGKVATGNTKLSTVRESYLQDN